MPLLSILVSRDRDHDFSVPYLIPSGRTGKKRGVLTRPDNCQRLIPVDKGLACGKICFDPVKL